MLKLSIWLAVGLLIGVQTAHAEGKPHLLCRQALKQLDGDPLLGQAFKVAYPDLTKQARAGDEPCVYPYKAIPYEGAVVLITFDQTPGEDCHGCPARLSAVFLRKNDDALVPVARHRGFSESGTYGSLMAITPVRLGSDDGIIVEGGGTFQGYSSGAIEAFIFRKGKAISLGPSQDIPMGYSDSGAVEEGEPTSDINAIWSIDPAGRLVVRYQGRRSDGTTLDGAVVYERQGDSLVVISGAELAAEMIKPHS